MMVPCENTQKRMYVCDNSSELLKFLWVLCVTLVLFGVYVDLQTSVFSKQVLILNDK
jgi:hypothetical protein